MKKILFILSTTMIFVSSANAFKFDLWKSGITMNYTIITAKKNNIPLMRKGYVLKGQNFNKKGVIGYEKTNEFRYVTKLLGSKALVQMIYTKKEKKLYELRVKWIIGSVKSKDFTKRLEEMLDTRYRGSVKKQINEGKYETIKWYPTKTIVGLSAKGTTIEVFYIDKVYKRMDEVEKETDSVFKKDYSKF